MAAVARVELRDPVAEARARYSRELLGIVEELAQPYGYEPGEFVDAARRSAVPETPETSELLVLAHVLR